MLQQLFIPIICRTRHLVQDGSTEEDGGDKNLRTRLEVGSWPEDSRTNTNCFSITGIHRGEHWRIVHHLCMYRSPPQPPPPTTEDASSPVRDRGTPESTDFTQGLLKEGHASPPWGGVPDPSPALSSWPIASIDLPYWKRRRSSRALSRLGTPWLATRWVNSVGDSPEEGATTVTQEQELMTSQLP